MSLAEAKGVLNGIGLGNIHVFEGKAPDGSQFTLLATPPNDPTSDRMLGLNFCEHQLTSVQVNYQPDYRRFVQMLEDQVQNFGQPISFMPSVDILSIGDTYNLAVYWLVGGEMWSVEYIEFPDGDLQLYRLYEAANKADLCSKSE